MKTVTQTSEYAAGRWAVFRADSAYNIFNYEKKQIAGVTEKLLRFNGGYPKQVNKDLAIGAFETEAEADLVLGRLKALETEYRRTKDQFRDLTRNLDSSLDTRAKVLIDIVARAANRPADPLEIDLASNFLPVDHFLLMAMQAAFRLDTIAAAEEKAFDASNDDPLRFCGTARDLRAEAEGIRQIIAQATTFSPAFSHLRDR